MLKDLRTLTLDIETAPMEVYVWGRRDQNISLEQIKKDWYILAFSAKWLGDPVSKIIYRDTRGKAWGDDKELLKEVWKLLHEADIVITQNGKRFDSRKLNARFILTGMKRPSPYKHIDTYKYLSAAGDFTSASLDYLTNNINKKYKKLSHKKFPGWKLWKACLENSKEAWAEMERYNKHDVLSTEELWLNTRSWVPDNAPKPYANSTPEVKCENCPYKGPLTKWGYYRTKGYLQQRLNCPGCGTWSKGKKLKLEAANGH